MTVGQGAVVTIDEANRLLPDNPIAGNGFLVKLRPGVGLDEGVAELQRTWGRTVLRSEPPIDIANVTRVRSLPIALAALVGLAAVIMLAFVLVTTVHQRRHELAVLKALGARGRQLRAIVAWQASTVIALAAAVGIPIGVVIGRSVWRLIADDLGTVAAPRVPLLVLAALAVGAMAIANLIAALPARAAARTPAAIALRAE
jgi:ABC-type antimicrobial peptide transport system permease subunit